MKYSASLKVDFPDENDAEKAMVAVSHEGRGSSRAAASVQLKGKTMEIAIKAKDATAFRAFINSFLRDFQVLEGATPENSD